MKKSIKLLSLTIFISILFACETETCKSCYLHYNVLNTGDYTSQELDDIAQSSLYENYDEYFNATYGESGNYCGTSLSILENESTNINLDNAGQDDLETYWVCE